ncbi:ABC transporter substrate-binding protein [Dehalococcoidia bacterium]|nr:ABC transporter substrate-binding protein [Dehalococcoidia bacterium]
MKNRIAKTIPMALALILMLTMAAGCPPPRPAEQAPTPAPAPAPEPMPRTITITDSAGREVEVSLPLERVIVINPVAAEVVHALGASDRVIGVSGPTAQDESLPGFHGKTVVSPRGHGEPDHEKIIELRPQLVITWGTHPAIDLVALAEILAPAGIPVVGVDAFRMATLFEDIETLGKLFEEEKSAARLVEFLQAQLDLIEGRVEGLSPDERVSVYAEHHGREFLAFGPGSDWHRMIEKVGGVNIFADAGRPFVDIDPEKVIVRNPQVILKNVHALIGFGATDLEPIRESLEGLCARPGWENLEAVKEGRVYLVSMDLSFGPLAILLHLYVGKILHPELFADLDPEAILREYFEEFHGVELKGIFIYPDP